MLQSVALVLAVGIGVYAWGQLRKSIAKLEEEECAQKAREAAQVKEQARDAIETLEVDEQTGIYKPKDD